MVNVRCPGCGAPVIIHGNQWECGFCGNFGLLSSLSPSERAKLKNSQQSITFTITDSDDDEDD